MRKHNFRLILFICAIASLSGVILGYDASVISGVIEPLTEHLALTPWESGWAVSNVILGCIVGAWGVGFISDRIGRKSTLIITAILFVFSAVGAALADSLTDFVIWRLVGGLAVGMASAITPLYIAEISPKDWRGRMLGLQQMLMVGGQVAVYIVNYLIARGMSHQWIVIEGWRWMLASGVVPCALFLLLVPFMPESPRWLALQGKTERARAVLTRLSNAQHADRLLQEILTSKQHDNIQTSQRGILRDARTRYILLIGCAIAILQQISGINILLYYAPSLLQNITASTQASLFQSIFLGLALLAGVAGCLNAIDRVGRTPLLRWGALGCAVCLVLTAWAFIAQVGGLLPVVGLVAFVLIFGLSWSLGAWLLISEIFPNRMRAVAMGFAFASMYVANFIVTQTFPMMNRNRVLMDHFHGAFPLMLCAVGCLVAFWFVRRFLPETRGVSLEHIEPLMLSKSRRFADETSRSDQQPSSSVWAKVK
ncbi:TPA: sugar porter family MFS transporter [Klebsiella pneumoniae]|uniref:sugar porter family MFS transporter n=1 Tax=Klebsiella TaxID=570 RepID=UPI000808D1AF|nr:sugar porter family MFS transporter [Klebsiella pneumoniae]HBQ5780260.1 sugar porter family MFS transporter [Klebsiella pneumoniae subsp. pneumoniae]MBK2735325.1 sugar porter family MFS transporter [Klebsiella pneumoniae]MDU5244826.1 sugar porter family MFS transporter [Klebsiella pneumoniae]WRP46061.1 sugar porter family MFS transporter [Klebsiella pneumoniae]SBY54273.1 sugar transporter [Klebsiella pneumoniae]